MLLVSVNFNIFVLLKKKLDMLEFLLVISLIMVIVITIVFDHEIKRYRKEISEYKIELNVRDTKIANLKSELENMTTTYKRYILHVNDIARNALFSLEYLKDGQCVIIASTDYLESSIKVFNLGDPELNTIYAEELLEKLQEQ